MEDYHLWLSQISALLEAKGLMGYADSTLHALIWEEQEPLYHFLMQAKEYSLKRSQALGIICSNISDDLLCSLNNVHTPEEAFRQLASQVELIRLACFIGATTKLFLIQILTGQKLSSYFNLELFSLTFPYPLSISAVNLFLTSTSSSTVLTSTEPNEEDDDDDKHNETTD